MKKVEPAKLTLKNGKEIFLIVKNDSRGDVDIVVVDEDGDEIYCGTIMTFTKNGFHRIGFINESIGLPLNSDQQLKKDKEY